uniref:Uncharacterized protein n=2 Tax=Cacopsylla melanoneura TaxID=428564 RepID=A0A8D8PWV8_9HEMI
MRHPVCIIVYKCISGCLLSQYLISQSNYLTFISFLCLISSPMYKFKFCVFMLTAIVCVHICTSASFRILPETTSSTTLFTERSTDVIMNSEENTHSTAEVPSPIENDMTQRTSQNNSSGSYPRTPHLIKRDVIFVRQETPEKESKKMKNKKVAENFQNTIGVPVAPEG